MWARRVHSYEVAAADAPARKALILAVHGRSYPKPLMVGEKEDGRVVFEHSGWSVYRALPLLPATLPMPDTLHPAHVQVAIARFCNFVDLTFAVMRSMHDLAVCDAEFSPELTPAEMDAYHVLFVTCAALRGLVVIDRAYYESETNVLLMGGRQPDSEHEWVLTLNCTGGSTWSGSMDIENGFTEGATPRMQALFREWRDDKKQAIDAFPFLPPLSSKRSRGDDDGGDADQPLAKKPHTE